MAISEGTLAIGSKVMLPNGSTSNSLSELNDVNISNASDGQVLVYDETTNKWKNENNNAEDVEYSTGVSVKAKIEWTYLGSFKFYDGQTISGTWNLTNNVPTDCNEICFYVGFGADSVGLKPRHSISVPFSVFADNGIIYDYTANTRVYFNVDMTSNSAFAVSSVTVGSGYNSKSFIYAYAR